MICFRLQEIYNVFLLCIRPLAETVLSLTSEVLLQFLKHRENLFQIGK